MNWNLEGMAVEGMYIDLYPVKGTVVLSRVAFGGRIKHTIVLDAPKSFYGTMRERVILDHADVTRVRDVFSSSEFGA
jgi:hypothetical protein